ncbi:hypothetical protein KY290_011605 [Solanum tuberosum]|uniref:Uncharacterized protein n=1 Tax=Solanum tuberosum TaxID=4113 RepID=A0ABQ7W168_SOLTU|nr:hypothetical protein KY290_011605 [Solanum tuberosum]
MPRGHINLFIVMNLSNVPSAIKDVGSIDALRRNAEATMMHWPMLILSAQIFLLTNFHVMMLKSEQVEVRVRDVCVPQHVEVALLVCALDVNCVVSQTAIARLALTSGRIQKLKSPFCLSICVI